MSKPVLVYVGHSYHRITRSTDFLMAVLQRDYQLEVVWDDAWQPAAPPLDVDSINALQPAVVLFFQTLPSRKQMLRLRCRRLFYIPMYDHVIGNSEFNWQQFSTSGLRTISFSQQTHSFFTQLKYDSIRVQYWPAPALKATKPIDGLEIFFWGRKREIGWNTLKALLGDTLPSRIVLRAAPDPGESLDMPSQSDIEHYNVEVVTGWLAHDRYLELLSACNVFMAPRLHEGIGQSILEAMSLGLAVIAPDRPTMNEYIRHGVNGYLYSQTAIVPMDFSNLASIRSRALQDIENGHQQWRAQQQSLLDYVSSKSRTGASLKWQLARLKALMDG